MSKLNLPSLLTQEPFGKWCTKFLREYIKSKPVYVSKIGNRALVSDYKIVELFIAIMVVEEPGKVITLPQLQELFVAWYKANATYHINYVPPKFILLECMRHQFDYTPKATRTEPGFMDVTLAVDTVEETIAFVSEQEKKIQHILPDFEFESERDRHEE